MYQLIRQEAMGRNGYTGKFHLHMRKNWIPSCATYLSRVMGPNCDQFQPDPLCDSEIATQ